MNALRAYQQAWRGIESDLSQWVRVGGDPIAFAEIQAVFADSLREGLADMDPFTRERVVLASLKALRDALRTVGIAPDMTVLQSAKRAVSKSALRVVAAQQDEIEAEERQEAFADLAAQGQVMWKWQAKLDSRTCLFCLMRHGKTFPVGVPLESHPNCRCRPVPEVKVLADGIEWLRRRSPATLRRMLGPGRAKLVQRGVAIDLLVDNERHTVRPLRDFGRFG